MASYKQIDHQNWEVSFYCKDYYGVNRKIKKRGFRTKGEAREFCNSYIAKTLGTSDIKFRDLFLEYVEYKKPLLKRNTQKTYKTILNKLKDAQISEVPLKDITLKHFVLFLKDYRKKTSMYKVIKQKLADCLSYAMIHYGLKENVLKTLKNEVARKEKTEKTIITHDDYKKMDLYLQQNPKFFELRVYVSLLYYTGARKGEIVGLMLKDVDLINGKIDINKTRISKKVYNSPKNDSSIRVVSIPSVTVELLKEHIKSIPDISDSYVFERIEWIEKRLKETIKKLGLKITPHSFRHSHASLLIKKGVPITEIAKRLGHKNAGITMNIYSHFYNEGTDKIIGIIEEMQ